MSSFLGTLHSQGMSLAIRLHGWQLHRPLALLTGLGERIASAGNAYDNLLPGFRCSPDTDWSLLLKDHVVTKDLGDRHLGGSGRKTGQGDYATNCCART